MNDIEKAINWLRKEKNFRDGYEPTEYIDLAISALEEKLNGGWIPVSERLPTSDGRFEVTIKGSKGKKYVEMCNFDKDAKFNKWERWYYSFNIIAWRSRPEPYKEVENE